MDYRLEYAKNLIITINQLQDEAAHLQSKINSRLKELDRIMVQQEREEKAERVSYTA
jgi:hypothetical protein